MKKTPKQLHDLIFYIFMKQNYLSLGQTKKF